MTKLQIILFEFTLHKNAIQVHRDLIQFLKEDEGYEQIDTTTYQLASTNCDKCEKKLRQKLQNYFTIRNAKNSDPGFIEFSIKIDNQLLYNESWSLR